MNEDVHCIISLEKAEYSKRLGLKLYQLRMESGLSQEKLAQRAGISAYTYQKFEKGESKPGTPMNPRMFTLMALADALDIPVAELLQVDNP